MWEEVFSKGYSCHFFTHIQVFGPRNDKHHNHSSAEAVGQIHDTFDRTDWYRLPRLKHRLSDFFTNLDLSLKIFSVLKTLKNWNKPVDYEVFEETVTLSGLWPFLVIFYSHLSRCTSSLNANIFSSQSINQSIKCRTWVTSLCQSQAFFSALKKSILHCPFLSFFVCRCRFDYIMRPWLFFIFHVVWRIGPGRRTSRFSSWTMTECAWMWTNKIEPISASHCVSGEKSPGIPRCPRLEKMRGTVCLWHEPLPEVSRGKWRGPAELPLKAFGSVLRILGTCVWSIDWLSDWVIDCWFIDWLDLCCICKTAFICLAPCCTEAVIFWFIWTVTIIVFA